MARKMKLPLRVNGFTDRYGKPRYYLRLPAQKPVALPGLPWSPEFMAAHEAGMAGRAVDTAPLVIGGSRTKPGTLNDAVVRFYESATFQQNSEAYQTRHRQVLDRFRQAITGADNVPRGERYLRTLNGEVLSKIISKEKSPHMQRHMIKAMRNLMKFAKSAQLIDINPAHELKARRLPQTGGFKVAVEPEIAQFQARHPLGTMARLALEIMLNTGLRREDATLIGRQHVRNGIITLKPTKTRNTTGIIVSMPVHSDLQAALDAMPPRPLKAGDTTPLTFLTTNYGKAFTVAGFGNWFRDQCVAAGVNFRAHGLRKAICIRLVRQGMTPHQVAAITGHSDLKEIELYAKSFDREKAAEQAMAALEKRKAQ